TVMRTIKKLGFGGFPAFHSALHDELNQTLSDPINKHDQWANDVPAEHILNQFAKAITSNLRQSLKQVDHKTFDDVVSLLTEKQRNIHIVGGRITHAFADYLQTHLQVIRKDIHMLPASAGLWPHHLLNVNAGDVLVIFDIRRYEADLLELAKLANQRELKIVLFTDQWLSPITSYATHYFSSRIEAPSGWDSGVVTLFLIESIIAAMEELLWPQTSSRLKELEDIFDFTGRFKR
ncbi:MAG: MurR/RpiR family transcriptional regulator, partial [Gammaproteobacteria bacterium]|nr:MurR/RpiR family transcriptional regulator [Gammaproteobacteria bacterium]